VEAGWKGDPRLKILCGGEALTRELANELLDRGGQVWNMYGPTETTIWSSTSRVERESVPVFLGRGIANTQFYVADECRQLAPIGVAGELYIGGAGVARGYWKRPELTAEKFVPNPFRADDGWERLYRTGDLVRNREDGKIEYLGRIDHQVKIRGYRIELGEIEAVLRQQAGVREAVVVEGKDSVGEKRLIGYVTGTNGEMPGKQELRHLLKQKLPDYMIPAVLVELEQIPLTPSGKIDRGALPKPELDEARTGTGWEAAEDELELQLTRIWERLLGRSPVGVRDDFFDLGGHSLMAVRLFTEMEKVLGRTLPLATLFTAPTIEQLAGILRRQGWEAPWSSLVTLQPRGSRPPFFCIHSLGTNLVSYRHLAQHMGNEQPFYGLQPQGLDGKQEPHTRVEEMAAHYIKEIRKVRPKGPYRLGGVCLGGVVAFEMAQQLLAEGEQVSRLVLIDSHFPTYPKHYLAGAFRRRGVAMADSYLGDLLALSGKEKLRYISNRARHAVARGMGHVQAVGDRFRGGSNGLVLPAVLRRVKDANALAEQSYVPRDYAGHIIQLWCSEMPTRSYRDRRLAWSEVAGDGLEVHVIPGNHMTMLEEPHLRILAEKLTNCLQDSHHIGQMAS
jgi:thioesterase domain-containing protein